MKTWSVRSIWGVMLFTCMIIFSQSVYGGEEFVTSTQTYYTDYYTSFSNHAGNNLFREANGTLHLAIIENYELYYLRSLDGGTTWAKEKVPTGHDGDIHWATLTVDRNGKVFIGFTANEHFNYGNPTSVGYSQEFHYDLYCASGSTGSWLVETIYNPARVSFSDNYGPTAMAMVVDADNDVHFFANRNGWWTYGGEAWEWVRSSSTGVWGSRVIPVSMSDTSVDRFFHRYYRPLVSSDGTITLVMARYKTPGGVNEELFYIQNSGSGWSAPVVIDTGYTRANAGTYGFDAAIDPSDNIHLVYWKDNGSGGADILYLKNFAAPTVIYTGDIDGLIREEIWDLKIHSNGSGDLTAVIRHGNRILADSTTEALPVSLMDLPAGGSWSAPYDLPTASVNGDAWSEAIAQTDTATGIFSHFQMIYYRAQVPTGRGGPYGPYDVYYYAEAVGPVPDVKANGSDGPITVAPGSPVTVAVSLLPGNQQGTPAEYWVIAVSPGGVYYYNYAGDNWLPGLRPTGVLPVIELRPTDILQTTLPRGVYTFYFGIDVVVDGLPQPQWLDEVEVRVENPE